MKFDCALMFDPLKIGEMANAMEKAGFDGAYAFEGKSDPFVSLTVAALNTTRMELMTSIAVAFARNPMNLAYLANDLQQLSGGRFILGLGTQVKAHIERRYSMPWSKPAARMREMVLAIKSIQRCWQNGDKLRFEGEFYQHTLMSPVFSPLPNPFGCPPIFVAGVGPLMTEVAAEVGDGYFLHPFNSERSMQALSMPAIERGLTASGRKRTDFQIAAQVITVTALDDKGMDDAIQAARNQIAFYASTPAYLPILDSHGWSDLQRAAAQLVKDGKWSEMANLVDDEMLNGFAVVGEPKEIARKILARYDGIADRISPVIYQPNAELLSAVLQELKAAESNH